MQTSRRDAPNNNNHNNDGVVAGMLGHEDGCPRLELRLMKPRTNETARRRTPEIVDAYVPSSGTAVKKAAEAAEAQRHGNTNTPSSR